MRILPIIIVGFVFASGAFLVQPVQAQPAYSLFGDVCAANQWDEVACDHGLPGATLRLRGGPLGAGLVDETATSSDDGGFQFDNVPQGDYSLEVTRQGFESASIDVSVPAPEQHVRLAPKQVTTTGTVTDASGAAVDGARVSLWGPDWGHAISDAKGQFSVTLLAGTYHLEIDAGKRGYHNQETFVDGSPLNIELGALPGQDAMVQGTVTDQDGNPVSGADVIVDQWERRTSSEYEYGSFRNWTVTDAEGRYVVDVYAGSLNLRFEKAGYAQAYHWVEVASGQTKTIDTEMAKYPEKTAALTGKVVGTDGKALTAYSISIQHPEYGLYTCSGGHHMGYPEPVMEPASDEAYGYPRYEAPACDIKIHDDGTFTGNVTPGYALINVWYDHYATCTETRQSNGDYRRECGADYFGYTETRVLQPDAQTAMTIVLRERPMADATISGYLIDGESGKTVPRAHVSFSNQENHAWGSAQTDKDGSYKVRLRAGYHHVNVWAEGYLPWQGVVFVAKGGETPFDVTLTAGESRYGGCCYAYDDVAYAEAEPAKAGGAEPRPMSASPEPMESPSSSAEAYEDLGGGLGPYDAAKRQQQFHPDAGKESPVPVALALIALALVAARRR